MNNRFETFTVLISKISRNIKKIKNQEMAEYDLRSAHISCLYYLYSNGALTATELCEKCEEDKATVSRSLDFLEKSGYIICNARCAKRYKSPLVLTEKGMIVGKKISDKITHLLDEIDIVLTENEREDLYRSLTIISERLCAIGEKLNDPTVSHSRAAQLGLSIDGTIQNTL